MITYDKIQSFMRAARDEDRERRSINVSGASLQDAIEQACIELQVSIDDLEYEVLEKGSSGMLGIGKKPYLLLAYAKQKAAEMASFDEDFGFEMGFDEDESQDHDGEALVKLTPDGVVLKIKQPIGDGIPVSENSAMQAITHRYTGKFNAAVVQRLVKNPVDEFMKIADYDYNPANDVAMTIELADAEMRAYLTLHAPGPGGADPTEKMLRQFLESNDVTEGINEKLLHRLDEAPLYGEAILIAEGSLPVNGRDGRIQYTFQTDTTHVNLKQDDRGRVDFKELNLVQNVVEGQALAKKVPPEPGVDGITVTGKVLPATNGKDCSVEVGRNVKLTDDGNAAIALINGQVLIHNNKIIVDPVYTVEGDVNLKTGNVTFLGTVLVKGSVEDGFSVKASGNIEIHGSVGKADIDAEGDVIVHQGITARNEGTIRCGKSVYAKFIENANVQAGEFVVVSDGIINSQVNCDRRIICRGKRAAIVGGHLRASEEIAAKTLGSVAGSETILEVGYDPRKREELDALMEREKEVEKQLDEAKLNVDSFENTVKSGKKLPKEKQQQYYEQRKLKANLTTEVDEIRDQMREINNYLAQLKSQGRISASATVYQGVRIYIKDAVQEVRSEYNAVTFVNEEGMVKITKYVEPEDISLGG